MSTNAQYPTGIHYSPSKWRSGEKEHLQAGSVATKDQLSFVSRRDRHADQISVLPNGASQKSNHSVRSILLSKKGLNITVLSSFKRINELWSVPAMNRMLSFIFSILGRWQILGCVNEKWDSCRYVVFYIMLIGNVLNYVGWDNPFS